MGNGRKEKSQRGTDSDLQQSLLRRSDCSIGRLDQTASQQRGRAFMTRPVRVRTKRVMQAPRLRHRLHTQEQHQHQRGAQPTRAGPFPSWCAPRDHLAIFNSAQPVARSNGDFCKHFATGAGPTGPTYLTFGNSRSSLEFMVPPTPPHIGSPHSTKAPPLLYRDPNRSRGLLGTLGNGRRTFPWPSHACGKKSGSCIHPGHRQRPDRRRTHVPASRCDLTLLRPVHLYDLYGPKHESTPAAVSALAPAPHCRNEQTGALSGTDRWGVGGRSLQRLQPLPVLTGLFGFVQSRRQGHQSAIKVGPVDLIGKVT